jgi:hypothetical protein
MSARFLTTSVIMLLTAGMALADCAEKSSASSKLQFRRKREQVAPGLASRDSASRGGACWQSAD